MRLLKLSRKLEEEVDWAAVARLCSAVGIAENVCATLDTMSWALPAGVLSAWLTTAACPADAPGLVFGRGEVNGVSAVAAADEPA